VFLQFVAPIVNVPPTKNSLFLYCPEEKEEDQKLIEIQTKGTCTKRLIDYGVVERSTLVMKQVMESSEESRKTYEDVARALKIRLTKAPNIHFDENYFGTSDDAVYQERDNKKRRGTPKNNNIN
jgi:hypothetical protein